METKKQLVQLELNHLIFLLKKSKNQDTLFYEKQEDSLKNISKQQESAFLSELSRTLARLTDLAKFNDIEYATIKKIQGIIYCDDLCDS